MNNRMIALDMAKNIFHAVIFGKNGQEQGRKKLRRNELVRYLVKQSVDTVVLEACASSHYWGRTFESLGIKAVLLPPQHVKGYLRGQKNDFNDAFAIGEAYEHGKIRPVYTILQILSVTITMILRIGSASSAPPTSTRTSAPLAQTTRPKPRVPMWSTPAIPYRAWLPASGVTPACGT